MPNQQSIEQAALKLLARREHSRQELIQKLSRKVGFDRNRIEQVVDSLATQGLQSDQRYAEVLIRHRTEQGYGPVRIRHELSQQSIDADVINAVWAELAIDWQACARRAYDKKYGDALIQDFQDKQKRQRFLYRRGFDNGLIEAIISNTLNRR